MRRHLFPAVFLIAVLVRIGLLLKMGDPFPPGLRSAANVYLELALNLWRDGTYGTRVSITYPPLYPLLVAPTFALDTNVGRFAAIYVLHGLLLAGGSLALFPTLKAALGDRRAWLLLAAAQFLFGGTFHGYNPQTETLFATEMLVAAGICGVAWSRPERVAPWVALGVVCGLAVSTRRFAVVLPIAVVLLHLHDMLRAWLRGTPAPWTRPLFLASGVALALVPEAAMTALYGGFITPYTGAGGSSAAVEHLAAVPGSLSGLGALKLALQTTARHVSYVVFTTGGAPVLIAVYLWRARHSADDEGVRRTLGLTAYLALGVTALTVLHILRYRLRKDGFKGWDLYPRYVDPLEMLLVLSGALAAWRLLVEGAVAEALAGARSRWARLKPFLPWAALYGLAVAAGTYVTRVRGGRMRSAKHWLETEIGTAGAYLFPTLGAIVFLGLIVWWINTRDAARGRRRWWWPVAVAVVVSWGISTHSWVPRLLRDAPPDGRTGVLKAVDLDFAPDTPLAVVVYESSPKGRPYYQAGFRSDHEVFWIGPDEARAWLREHRGGAVLVRRRDPQIHLPLVRAGKHWSVQSANGRGAAKSVTPE